jgi:hypothetical protein
MSNDLSYLMAENIQKRIKTNLILFFILVLIGIWAEPIIAYIMGDISYTKENISNKSYIIKTFYTGIGYIVIFVLNLFRDINLHVLLDAKVLGIRKITGNIIINEMLKASKKVKAKNYNSMITNKEKVMYIFYHFINNQVTLRQLAFTYWEQYYVNIYTISIGIISLIILSIDFF